MPDPDYRRLPPVNAVMAEPSLADPLARSGHEAVVAAIREAIAQARLLLAKNGGADVSANSIARMAANRLDAVRPSLRSVLNASGILLHTGLGRAPLAVEAVEAVSRIARGYCNLEFDLETGRRGSRSSGVADLLRDLVGAEAAAVVNNNAAATVLALRASAIGREVVVSRGELIEIGGGFRLPEVFEAAGVRLREVGTTNRTRLADYERAIGPETACLLRVHPSNYRIVGFTESVAIADLAALGKSRGLVTIDDVGSGALDVESPGVPNEPTVAEGLRGGADLVLASGDKLLGGPQCGLILGTKAAVGRLASDPMMRAFRVDKMTLAALEATLRLARDPEFGRDRIPLWRFLATPTDALASRADAMADSIRREAGVDAQGIASEAFLGGGSDPARPIPSAAVRIRLDPALAIEDLARGLRLGDPAVVPRIHDGALLLDLRAVDPAEDHALGFAVIGRIAETLRAR